MNGKQMEIKSPTVAEIKLEGEALDKALHDVMTTLWKAYRESVTTQNYAPYNNAFPALYEKYTDKTVVRYIEGFGMGMVNALNRRIEHG